MKTANQFYVPRLDVLRLFAATLVVLHHTYGSYPIIQRESVSSLPKLIFTHGHVGVSLFLVMSGYLMGSIYIRNPNTRYSDFIYNRTIRVIPLCLLFFMGTLTIHQADLNLSQQIINLISLQFSFDRKYQIAPIWTIAIEFQFYLIVPFISKILYRDGTKCLIKICLVLLIFRFFLIAEASTEKSFTYDISYYSIIGRIDQFILGMLIAKRDHEHKLVLANPIHFASSIFFLLCLFIFSEHHNWWAKGLSEVIIESIYLTIEGLVCGYFMISFIQMRQHLPGERLLAFLGASSYSIYLWHLLIIATYFKFFPYGLFGASQAAVFVNIFLVILPIVYIISLLSFMWLEIPILSFRRKYKYD